MLESPVIHDSFSNLDLARASERRVDEATGNMDLDALCTDKEKAYLEALDGSVEQASSSDRVIIHTYDKEIEGYLVGLVSGANPSAQASKHCEMPKQQENVHSKVIPLDERIRRTEHQQLQRAN